MLRKISILVVAAACVTALLLARGGGSHSDPVVLAVAPNGMVSCTNYGGTNHFVPDLYANGTGPFVEQTNGVSGSCTQTGNGDPIAYAVATITLRSAGPRTCAVAANTAHPTGTPVSFAGPNMLTVTWHSTNPTTGAPESWTTNSTMLLANYASGGNESETWQVTGGTDGSLISQDLQLTDVIGAPAPATLAADCASATAAGGLRGDQSTNGNASV